MSLHILQPGDNVAMQSLAASPMASARMRLWPAARAATEMGHLVTVGEHVPAQADILLVGKIGAGDIGNRAPRWLTQINTARAAGGRVLLDYTDHHLTANSVMTPFYQSACSLADVICVPTMGLAEEFGAQDETGNSISVVSDPLEYDLVRPKPSQISGQPRALWFGHPSNASFLAQFIEQYSKPLSGHHLEIVSAPQTVEILKGFRFSSPPELSLFFNSWSLQAVSAAASRSDYCVIPSDPKSPKRFASNNRLVTALALGLPTIATALPSYQEVGTYFAETGTNSTLELMAKPLDFGHQVAAFQDREAHRFTLESVVSSWRKILADR